MQVGLAAVDHQRTTINLWSEFLLYKPTLALCVSESLTNGRTVVKVTVRQWIPIYAIKNLKKCITLHIFHLFWHNKHFDGFLFLWAFFLEKKRSLFSQYKLEGARESAYLRQVNFYRRSVFQKKLRGRVLTVPGNMHVKFEVRSFNRFGAICI